MNISIHITKTELLAGMAYQAELEKVSKMIEEGFGQKSESKSSGFKLPTFSHTTTTKAFRAQATLGLGGMDVKLDIEPQCVSEILELYAKFANRIAIPIAQFVLAMVMSVTEFDEDVKSLAKKWLKEDKVEA